MTLILFNLAYAAFSIGGMLLLCMLMDLEEVS